MLAVNLRGVFLGCQLGGAHMREQRRGRIVNLSSLAGQQGSVVNGAHYAASKAGILALTKAVARELAPFGVTVNAVAPAGDRRAARGRAPAGHGDGTHGRGAAPPPGTHRRGRRADRLPRLG